MQIKNKTIDDKLFAIFAKEKGVALRHSKFEK